MTLPVRQKDQPIPLPPIYSFNHVLLVPKRRLYNNCTEEVFEFQFSSSCLAFFLKLLFSFLFFDEIDF